MIISDVDGIEDVNARIDFTIYPNPAANVLTVRCEMSLINKLQFELIDMLGSQLIFGDLKSDYTKIDVSEIPNGVYFLKVKGASNASLKKVVINN
jgi:hypothetical protein